MKGVRKDGRIAIDASAVLGCDGHSEVRDLLQSQACLQGSQLLLLNLGGPF